MKVGGSLAEKCAHSDENRFVGFKRGIGRDRSNSNLGIVAGNPRIALL
jgi:hypothetical protein